MQFSASVQVREQIEAGFVSLVAASVSEPHLRTLWSVVEDLGRRVAREESTRDQDRYFHRLLYEPVANPLLEQLLDVFWEVAWRSPGAAGASA